MFLETFNLYFLMLMILALGISSIGFYKFVYFISLGYGFSIAGLGILMIILFRNQMGIGILLACAFLVLYGNRLGWYLLVREWKSSSYRNTMKKEVKDGSNMNFFVKVLIWVSCALLYVCQVSPVFFRAQNQADSDIVCYIGIAIMALGIACESIADLQKSWAKKKNPIRFCDKGLYRIVRCPNYLGEILFWTGVLVTGVTALQNVWEWVAAVLGYLCIVYIMFGGARRLELRQNRNYGADEEYQNYVKKTPILIPLLPLYSVANQKWLVG